MNRFADRCGIMNLLRFWFSGISSDRLDDRHVSGVKVPRGAGNLRDGSARVLRVAVGLRVEDVLVKLGVVLVIISRVAVVVETLFLKKKGKNIINI